MGDRKAGESEVLEALKSVIDPDLGSDIVSLGFIKDLSVKGGKASFTIELTTPACPVREMFREQADKAVRALPGIRETDIRMTARVRQATAAPQKAKMDGIRNLVAVASGKGGVGKSTVTANLALALAGMGAKVGVMDADVYGPSIPLILGTGTVPEEREGKLEPAETHGLKTMSMEYFIEGTDAVIWRGPMLHRVVEQFLAGVNWGELDYLLIDLPPGTGDVQLSLCQLAPLTGAVIVSTPQDVALRVAEKAVSMFTKLSVPILGLVENMSGFTCPHCGRKEDIFGAGGAQAAADRLGTSFLGAIPLLTGIREASDLGNPVVVASPESPAAKAFMETARALAARISVVASPAGAVKAGGRK